MDVSTLCLAQICYIVFTLLALLGVYALIMSKRRLIFNTVCVLLGCVGVIITGSVGGIVSLSGGLIIILLNQFRFSYFLYAVIFGSASFWAVANLVNYEGIAVVRRLLYKQNDLSGESRYYMWGELLEKKFSC